MTKISIVIVNVILTIKARYKGNCVSINKNREEIKKKLLDKSYGLIFVKTKFLNEVKIPANDLFSLPVKSLHYLLGADQLSAS